MNRSRILSTRLARPTLLVYIRGDSLDMGLWGSLSGPVLLVCRQLSRSNVIVFIFTSSILSIWDIYTGNLGAILYKFSPCDNKIVITGERGLGLGNSVKQSHVSNVCIFISRIIDIIALESNTQNGKKYCCKWWNVENIGKKICEYIVSSIKISAGHHQRPHRLGLSLTVLRFNLITETRELAERFTALY